MEQRVYKFNFPLGNFLGASGNDFDKNKGPLQQTIHNFIVSLADGISDSIQ